MYHLFVSAGYYPAGFDDYVDSYETFEEAKTEGLAHPDVVSEWAFYEIAETTEDGKLRLASNPNT